MASATIFLAASREIFFVMMTCPFTDAIINVITVDKMERILIGFIYFFIYFLFTSVYDSAQLPLFHSARPLFCISSFFACGLCRFVKFYFFTCMFLYLPRPVCISFCHIARYIFVELLICI